MEETEKQRDNRRAISQWLTKQINDLTINEINEAIRLEVLKALQDIDKKLAHLREYLKKDYHINDYIPTIDFYIKGGNAYKQAMNELDKADSDWDTQVVIDPWCPVPIQEVLHGRTEDIVLDSFRDTGDKIAKVITDYTNKNGIIICNPKDSITGNITITHDGTTDVTIEADKEDNTKIIINKAATFVSLTINKALLNSKFNPSEPIPTPNMTAKGKITIETDGKQDIVIDLDDSEKTKIKGKVSGKITLTTTNTQQQITLEAGSMFVKKIQDAWAAENIKKAVINNEDLSNYALNYDNPQLIKKTFDREQVGLSLTERQDRKSRDSEVDNKWLPGMSFNDAIKHFVIYRLGYTWHLEPPVNDVDPPVLATKPILMELIDVTIPRRDTVEGVEVWESINPRRPEGGDNILPTMKVIREKVQFMNNVIILPFPDLEYHFREQLTMICEVADGSSHHADKMPKRFRRMNDIYQKDDNFKKIIYEQVGVTGFNGVEDSTDVIKISNILYKRIMTCVKTDEDRKLFSITDNPNELNPVKKAYRLGILMMKAVATETVERQKDFNGRLLSDKTKQTLKVARDGKFNNWLNNVFKKRSWSDDLVLMDFLEDNRYLMLNEVGLCGIDIAAIGRVDNYTLLSIKIDEVEALVKISEDKGWTMKYRSHTTVRPNGLTCECTFVFFKNGKAKNMLTLTTASEQEVPLIFDVNSKVPPAPFAEVARQRKMAASLIDDYIVKTALSKQYEACKEIINIV
jgi:hypothetical protein